MNNEHSDSTKQHANKGVEVVSDESAKRRGVFSEWSRRIRQSDRRAFAEMFNAMNEKLVRYASGITKDEESAYDVLQDVFLKLWEKRETLDPQSSLQSLLYTMTRNASLNVNRRKGYLVHDDQLFERSELGTMKGEAPSDEKLNAKQLTQKVYQWIDELPQRRREAFTLSRQHDLSHKEISEIMGLSERTVNTHIFLALKHLRGKLDALQNDR